MSARVLQRESHSHTLADDLESLLYVLIWTVVRFFKTNQLHPRASIALMFNEENYGIEGDVFGGDTKKTFMCGGSIYGDVVLQVLDNVPVTTLIHTLRRMFRRRYDADFWVDGTPPDVDVQKVIDALEAAYNSPDWPVSEAWSDCLDRVD
jgi:hypothetical protein